MSAEETRGQGDKGTRRPRARAFTLMEMLVVLALMAVLTATVSLSLRGTARAARIEDAAGRVASFDRTAREAARRFGSPLELRFDLNRGTVHRAGGGRPTAPLRLPEGFRVAALALPGGELSAGEVRVPVSIRGHTPSYAARVEGANGEEIWLVAAGLTGRTLVSRDAAEVQQIFATGRTAGGHPANDNAANRPAANRSAAAAIRADAD